MILRPALIPLLSALTTFLSYTSADVSFSSPSAGQAITGSDITVTFADGPTTPSLSTFVSYTLQLCAGGNTDGTFVSPPTDTLDNR